MTQNWNEALWKRSVERELIETGSRIRRYCSSPEAYASVAAAVLSPLLDVNSRSGITAGMVLGKILDSEDILKIADVTEKWSDLQDVELLMSAICRSTLSDTIDSSAIDKLILHFDAFSKLASFIKSEADYLRYIQALRTSIEELGKNSTFRELLVAINRYEEANIQKRVDHYGGAEISVDGHVSQSVIIAGDENKITYIAHYYMDRPDQEHYVQELEPAIREYLNWVQKRYGRLKLVAVKRGDVIDVPDLDLNKAYVPLRAQIPGETAKAIDMDEILGIGSRLVVTGGPGSGKTVVLLQIANTLAYAKLHDDYTHAVSRLGLTDYFLKHLRSLAKETQVNANRFLQKVESLAAEVRNSSSEQDETSNTGKKDRSNIRETERLHEAFRHEVKDFCNSIRDLRDTASSKYPAQHELCLRLTELIDALEELKADSEWYESEGFRKCAEHVDRIIDIVETVEPVVPIPVFVPLRRFAEYLNTAPPGRTRTLSHFVSVYLEEQLPNSDLPKDFFVKVAQSGRDIILLLDGLDEVASESERRQTIDAIENLVTTTDWLNVIVTCRSSAFSGTNVPSRGFQEVRVAPLEDFRVKRLVSSACMAIYVDEDDAQERASSLLEGIRQLEDNRRMHLGPTTPRLITTPLLVRLLLIVHYADKKLPEQRAHLFNDAIETMLRSPHVPDSQVATQIETAVGGKWERHRELVQYLAYMMHTRGQQSGSKITEHDARKVLQQHPSHSPYVDEFLTVTKVRGSLLEYSNGSFQFIHLSFQEYLVARYFAQADEYHQISKILAFFDESRLLDSWWREPILLLAGYLSRDPSRSEELIRRLSKPTSFLKEQDGKPVNPDAILASIVLAANAFLEWHADRRELGIELGGQLVDGLKLEVCSPLLRLEAGDCLARIGDPRFNRELWGLPADPTLGFVEIPEGLFIMGRDEAGHESPRHEVHLPTYYIARYPVTVGQFNAYVETLTGVQREHLQTSLLGLQEPSNYPIRGLTFHHAAAYCNWLNERLLAPELEDNPICSILSQQSNGKPKWIISLPSEAQWEKAARGTQGHLFPWGDDADPNRVNVRDTGINGPCAVGCFHNGMNTEYGIEDCVGNVWEWTAGLYKAYPYPSHEHGQIQRSSLKRGGPRVLRGGSFKQSLRSVPTTARLHHKNPGWRTETYGFRLAIIPNPDLYD